MFLCQCFLALTVEILISVFALSDNCCNDNQADRGGGTRVSTVFWDFSQLTVISTSKAQRSAIAVRDRALTLTTLEIISQEAFYVTEPKYHYCWALQKCLRRKG